MNRLSSEKSPYLLQHAANPVDWYPWGDEAFEAARRLDRPIFLSVGYSTCHWCHVMAHESFEDPAVAAILNECFVPVKVDREERPDVDRVYMAFVQATTGGGGWPMSVWLLPDLRPFFGGTYFPPVARWGKAGFADLLRQLDGLWRTERPRIEAAAAGVIEHLAGAMAADAGAGVPGRMALDGAVRDLLENYDRRSGGFGGAPKFPRPSELLFLMREHARTGDGAPLDAVRHTLRAMAAGGVRDHVGGGFHRYSVDAQWRVPHFEKMLYDQAQIVLACLEAAQASGDEMFLEIADDTLEYVRRDLTSREGGFFSAEDADSLPPGEPEGGHKAEGAFYLWRADEIEALLEAADARVFKERFGVREDGNALQDPQGEFAGHNILYEARSIGDVAGTLGMPRGEIAAALERSRAALFAARARRPRPHLDDKILTAWNGLMIAAFARASRVEDGLAGKSGRVSAGRVHLASAQRAAAFIRQRLWDGASGRLLRRYRDGDAAIDGYAEDYAFLVFGLLELFQADGDPAWLEWAVDLQRRQDELFGDDQAGGWFSTVANDRAVLLRLKDEYDGAEPAATSVSALNLLTFSHLGAPVENAGRRLEEALRLFAPRLTRTPRAVPMMLCALSAWHASFLEVVVSGREDEPGTSELRAAFDASFQPFSVVVAFDHLSERGRRLAAVLPWLSGMLPGEGGAAAYVCRGFACDLPVTRPAELEELLRSGLSG